jgi:tetrahydromethanopterin S-methyltransferase subunit G
MNLAEDDIAFIKAHLGEWLAEQSLGKPPAVYEIELRERMVRVEEELRHQRELMKQGFDLMEKRFEQIDKRFEQVDSRFEQITRRIDRFMIWTLGLYVAGIGSVLAMIWHTSTP